MRFSSLNAEEFMRVAKMILSGDAKGEQYIQRMVDDIVKELKEQEYKDAMGYDDDEDEDYGDDYGDVDLSDLDL